MPTVRWQPGGFLDNFDAAAKHLGYDHIPLAFGLAKVDWASVEDRDAALKALVNLSEGGSNAVPGTP